MKHTEPTYINASQELSDELEPSAKEMADLAVAYKRLQRDVIIVDSDGVKWTETARKKELESLNAILKDYIQHHGDLSIEGVGTLTLQHPTAQKVDVRSLWEHDRDTFMRLLESNGFEVNSDVLKGLEKAGLVAADVPRFPVGGSVRLVWRKDA